MEKALSVLQETMNHLSDDRDAMVLRIRSLRLMRSMNCEDCLDCNMVVKRYYTSYTQWHTLLDRFAVSHHTKGNISRFLFKPV